MPPTQTWRRPGASNPKKAIVCLVGRKSAFERGDDEAEVHEYLEDCRRTPMHPGEWTLSEPGIWIWTPSNDLAQSRRRGSSVTEVPGRQWDALKPLCCGCQIALMRQPTMPSLTAPVPRAGPAGVFRRGPLFRGGKGAPTKTP